ncbi:MAG: hypothetical protein ACW99A_00265 [Candidatus Kariarchaeaceae archaeon]|jgi:hypothetical protein
MAILVKPQTANHKQKNERMIIRYKKNSVPYYKTTGLKIKDLTAELD